MYYHSGGRAFRVGVTPRRVS
ncbi:hypothetical protein Gotur_019684, partial [Gossypium turneri]